MNEPYINRDLIDKIRQARERTFDADKTYDTSKEDERHLSEMYRIMQNYDDREQAVCVAAVLDNNPMIVYQVLAEDREELLRKGKRKDENSNAV